VLLALFALGEEFFQLLEMGQELVRDELLEKS
jgi:hypothetical protein